MRLSWTEIKQRIQSVLKKKVHPKLSVPESMPLSPCIIEPYVENEGKEEENKAYMPVSLLIRALDDDRMLNIAVAGNYGVGKSSIINTAERKVGNKHKFIKISLASLLTQEGKAILKQKEQGQDKEQEQELGKIDGVTITIKEEKSHNKEKDSNAFAVSDKQIEYSILQQILYHERSQKTPKSRIRRIHKTRKSKPYWIAFWGLLTIASILLLIKPSWLNVSDYINLERTADWVRVLFKWGPIVILTIVFILICRYYSRHYTFSLSRIGYKNIEMKITDEMSIFNAHMDEIVYFFESTNYDVVVFEDLDRFINKDVIFYKLRELNTVLNNCKCLRHKVNFVYAVLDHLFDATERVKFFDYIITVIPVINSLNSYNMLKKSIHSDDLFERLGGNELLNLCEYLQDMRLLLNIVNEFNQFSPLLDKTVMKEKILFGLIVYKNYAPTDFSGMYNKSGVVAGILENTDVCRESIIDKRNNQIAQYRQEIILAEEERDKELYGLRQKYLETGKSLSGYPSNPLRIRIGDAPFLFEAVAKDPILFKKVRDGQANYLVNNSLVSIPAFNSVELNLGGPGNFDKTEANILNECEVKVEGLKKKIVTLSQEVSTLPKTVEGVYRRNTVLLDKELDKLEDKEKQDLIKFLILNGYLDKDYQYYISYFYPNSLKLKDRNFVMRAGRQEGNQYEVELDAVDEILKRFTPEKMAENHSLLNVNLVRAIFQGSTHQVFRDAVCVLIEKTSSLDFVIAAYNAENSVSGTFFFHLLKKYDFWDEIGDRTEEEQDTLREIYFKFCDLREEKKNAHFCAWLVDNYSFLDKRWKQITEKRALEVFKSCTPVFSKLSIKDTPDAVLTDILDNRRYVLSRQNLNAIVRKLGFFDKYKTAAFSSLMEADNKVLLDTVCSNWAVFLKSVFPDTSLYEGEKAQVEIINATKEAKSGYAARYYLVKQHNHLQRAELLNVDVLQYAYEYSLIAPTWHNVYYYSINKDGGLPLQLIYKNTFHDMVGESLTSEEEDALRGKIVFTNTLKQTKYEELVPLFTTPFKNIEKRIQPARMRFILENNLLVFNEENYTVVREEYGLSKLFLVNNIGTFLMAPEKYHIDSDDAVAALEALNTKKAKCAFIRSIKGNNLLPNSELTDLISPYVINGDLKVDDISFALLNAIISQAPADKRVPLGRKALLTLELDNRETADLLLAIGGEFKRLTTNTVTSSITYSRDAVLIINHLVDTGFVKGYEKKEDKLVVTKQSAGAK